MEGKATITGLKDAMKAVQAAFPDDPKQQQRIVHGAMGGAARKTMLPIAKQLALRGDGSGALSEALKVRAMPARKRRGKAGGMIMTPVRSDLKAMAKYIQHYFTSQGLTPSVNVLTGGIRHGHLVEFGTIKSSASPFMWPAAKVGSAAYVKLVATGMKKRMEAAVKRAARKRAKR